MSDHFTDLGRIMQRGYVRLDHSPIDIDMFCLLLV
jgi:hypothetical protein